MRDIVGCPNCGSEKFRGLRCGLCNDLSASEYAIDQARSAYASEAIDVPELERRVADALRDTPPSPWGGFRLVMR